MRGPPWTAAEVEALGRHIDAGRSAGETAKLMRGRSRCALLSKAWYFGWTFGRARTEEQRQAPASTRAACLAARRLRYAITSPGKERVGFPVYVTFDSETYAEIMARVNVDKVSAAQIVRELVEWGLEAVRLGDAA